MDKKRKIDNNLLEYLRKKLKNPDISFKARPKRLIGGYEAQLFSFQLEGAPMKMSKQLVVRLTRYGREGVLMQYLTENGFPTPSVYYDCYDPSILGENFIIMDFVPGTTLLEYKRDVPRIMAETHLHLHRIDSRPLRKRLLSAGWEERSFTGLTWYEPYIRENGVSWLKLALKWINENKPETTPAICHGDLHPGNIMINEGKVSGVLDWNQHKIEDPTLDIATIITVMSIYSPLFESQFSDSFSPKVAEEYLDLYRERIPVATAKLEYFQAFKCLIMMVHYERARREMGIEVFHAPGILEAIIELFKNITGIEPIPD
jgi:aminoglycoside phosphotransferase (APT) family kinase protein